MPSCLELGTCNLEPGSTGTRFHPPPGLPHSRRARGRPGWAYLSVNRNTTGANAIEKHSFSLKLDGSGKTAGSEKVNQWVHMYVSVANYDRNPFAVPNRDGSKIMFASDWGDTSGEHNSYIVEMP